MQGIRSVVITAIVFWSSSILADVKLQGRVVSKAGKPVAGARVFCLKPAPINSYPGTIETTTNAEGAFELTIAGPATAADLKGESVLIHAEGHRLGVITIGALLTSLDTVTLPEPTNLSFGLLDPQGRVAAGELVEPVNYLYGTGGASFYGTGMKLPETLMQVVGSVSDDSGNVRLPALSDDKMRTIQVVSEKYGHQELGWPAGIKTVKLRPTASVEVEFDGPAGLTLSKGRIVAFTGSFDGAFGPNDKPTSRPTTGVHTEFYDHPKGLKIPVIAEGHLGFRLTSDANDEPVLPKWPQMWTQLKAGTAEKIVVPLEPTVAIHGRIVDQRTGRPAANVSVVIGAPANRNVIATRTDDEGRYRCKVLKGPVSIAATQGNPSDLVYGGSRTAADVQTDDFALPDMPLAPTAAGAR